VASGSPTPVGAPETGGGSSTGDNLPLALAGGVLLLGAAASAPILVRRRIRQQQS
jgi:hypothetical protein